MKLNRKLVLILSLALSLALATGGTLAYLSDTDADVNVMTLGNVYIVQNEQERDADGELVAFTQNKPAYPAVGTIDWAEKGVKFNDTEYKVFSDDLKNVIDKFVTVTNTGNSDAYVRTIVAIEAPGFDPDGLIHLNYNGTDFEIAGPYNFTDNGVDYSTFVFTYKNVLKADETTAPSLLQLFLDSKATNEDVAKFGDTWEVRVLSQAVQTAGFKNAAEALEAAFPMGTEGASIAAWMGTGEGNMIDGNIGSPDGTYPEGWVDNNPPSGEVTMVSTLEELKAALEEGGTIILKNDITMDNMIKIAEGVEVTLNLNGKTIDFDRNTDFKPGNPLFYPLPGSKLTFTGNGTVDLGANMDTALVYPAGEVVFENGTYIRDRIPEGTSTDEVQTLFMGVKSVGASVVIKDGYFDSGYYDSNAEKAFSETAADVTNRGKAADKNAYRTAIKNNVSLLINLSWSSAAGTQDFRIYGGTFVGANPAWGDEGCAMPITPDYLRPWSYYQGMFLDGQKMYDDKIEIPAGYNITESKTSDGRPVFTVEYSK